MTRCEGNTQLCSLNNKRCRQLGKRPRMPVPTIRVLKSQFCWPGCIHTSEDALESTQVEIRHGIPSHQPPQNMQANLSRLPSAIGSSLLTCVQLARTHLLLPSTLHLRQPACTAGYTATVPALLAEVYQRSCSLHTTTGQKSAVVRSARWKSAHGIYSRNLFKVITQLSLGSSQAEPRNVCGISLPLMAQLHWNWLCWWLHIRCCITWC